MTRATTSRGLGDIVVCSHRQSDNPIHLLAAGGHEDDWHFGVAAKGAQNLDTVEIRQADVEQHEARVHGLHQAQSLCAAARLNNREAVGFQIGAQHAANRWFVVDDEDSSRHGTSDHGWTHPGTAQA